MPGEAGGGTWGPNPFSRQELIQQSPYMSPVQLFAWQRMGFMPGHATNILSRLAQSGCCPGARGGMGPAQDPNSYASGERLVRCANGNVYSLENWQGGIRAVRTVGSGPADCDTVHEGTWALVERGKDVSGWGQDAEVSAIEQVQDDRAMAAWSTTAKLAGLFGLLAAGSWAFGHERMAAGFAGAAASVPIAHALGFSPSTTDPRKSMLLLGGGALAGALATYRRSPLLSHALGGASTLPLIMAAGAGA